MDLRWVASVLVVVGLVMVQTAQALNVSKICLQDTNAFLWEVNQTRPRKYAALMYDAFGKMGSDVEGGNVNRPGSLQECLSVRGPAFSGQYCQVFLKQDVVQYFVGICVPDSCTEKEVQTLVVHETLQQGKVSLIPPLPSILISNSTQGISRTQCLSRHATPDLSAVTCLFVCCVMVAIPLAATLFMAVIRWRQRREVSPGVESALNTNPNLYGTMMPNAPPSGGNRSSVQQLSETHISKEQDNSCVHWFLQVFPLQRTCQGVLCTTSNNPGRYTSLNGIRVLSLFWIICGHSMSMAVPYMDNQKVWKETVERNPMYVFAASGPIYLAVDSFLILGGLLNARSLLSAIRKSEDKLKPSMVANRIFNRLKRFQPLHMFIVCLEIGLYPVIQGGAFWFLAEEEVKNCKKNWWANLLLVHNLFTTTDICAPWTWYLSLDFQYFATTPLLIFLYRLNKGILAAVAAALLLISCLSSAVVTALLQLPVHHPVMPIPYSKYFTYYYKKPYTRYGPYLIGILAGIYMTTKKDLLLKHKWQAALGWLSCLLGMAVLIGLAYALRDVPPGPSVPHALYQGLHRPLWALGVAWIIVACEEGYGGFINSLLSFDLWLPLSNISFACYLIHPVLIIIYNIKQETPIHYTGLNFMYLFFSHLLVVLVMGYVLTVLVEKPYLLLKPFPCFKKVKWGKEETNTKSLAEGLLYCLSITTVLAMSGSLWVRARPLVHDRPPPTPREPALGNHPPLPCEYGTTTK